MPFGNAREGVSAFDDIAHRAEKGLRNEAEEGKSKT